MITKVEFSKEVGGVHKLWAGEKEILAKTVIISTGATAKYLGLEDEKKYSGGGDLLLLLPVCCAPLTNWV
jgi:thioredoxin reductase (NADPH)